MTRASLRRAAAGAALAALAIPAGAAAAALLGARTDLTDTELAAAARVVAAPNDFTSPEPFEAMAGGAATSRAAPGPESLAQPIPGLSTAEASDFALGRAVFRKLWVAAPSSTHGSDGLGPLYDARSCNACHLRDGRGRSPTPEGGDGFVLRLGTATPDGRATADPVYGHQLQQNAVTGLAAEGRVAIDWTEVPVTLATAASSRSARRLSHRGSGLRAAGRRRGALAARRDGARRHRPPRRRRRGRRPGRRGPGRRRRRRHLRPRRHRRRSRDGPSRTRPLWLEGGAADAGVADRRRLQRRHGALHPPLSDPAGDCTSAETACRAMPAGAAPGEAEVPAVLLTAAPTISPVSPSRFGATSAIPRFSRASACSMRSAAPPATGRPS